MGDYFMHKHNRIINLVVLSVLLNVVTLCGSFVTVAAYSDCLFLKQSTIQSGNGQQPSQMHAAAEELI